MNQIKQKTSGFNIYDEIPLTELVPFKNHPFKVKDDAEMDALKKSIEESGVLVPAVARYNPHGDGYELIAGHRRFAACRALSSAFWASSSSVRDFVPTWREVP